MSFVLPIGFRLEPNDDKTGFNKEIFDNPSFPAPTDDPNAVVPAVNHTLEPKPGVWNATKQGSVFTLKSRGMSFGNNPLYILNGVKMSKDYSINTLDSKDIEAISILKDASATAIYGKAGANGVIIITTKTGQKNETKPADSTKH